MKECKMCHKSTRDINGYCKKCKKKIINLLKKEIESIKSQLMKGGKNETQN